MGSGMTTNRQVSNAIIIDSIQYHIDFIDLKLKMFDINILIIATSRPKSILLPQLWYLDNTGQV